MRLENYMQKHALVQEGFDWAAKNIGSAGNWIGSQVAGLGSSIADTVKNMPASVKEYPGHVMSELGSAASRWASDPIGTMKNNPVATALTLGFPAWSAYNIYKDDKAKKDPEVWGQWAGTTLGGLGTVGANPGASAKSVIGTSGIMPAVGLMMAGVPAPLLGAGAVARWGLGGAGRYIGSLLKTPETATPEADKQRALMHVWTSLDPSIQSALLSYGKQMGLDENTVQQRVIENINSQQHHQAQ